MICSDKNSDAGSITGFAMTYVALAQGKDQVKSGE
jgi:hypothetical protein